MMSFPKMLSNTFLFYRYSDTWRCTVAFLSRVDDDCQAKKMLPKSHLYRFRPVNPRKIRTTRNLFLNLRILHSSSSFTIWPLALPVRLCQTARHAETQGRVERHYGIPFQRNFQS